jgi:hypothetical protein
MTLVLVASILGLGFAAPPPPTRADLIYTEAPVFHPAASERFPSGARLLVSYRGFVRPLVPDFAASADPALSFDATRVIFSGKRAPGEPWRIWEIALGGGRPRPISTGDGDCLRPLYLPLQKVAYARRTAAGLRVEAAPLAGGPPTRLTFAPLAFLPAAILHDGRILLEAGDLYAVYSDGAGVEAYRCDHGPARSAAAQLASGDIVFQADGGMARFTSARAGQVDVALPHGEYFGPVADSGGRWLLSCRPSPGAPVSLCTATPDSTQPPAILVRGSDRGGLWQPVQVAPRAAPPFHPSSLGEFDGANLLCLNAYRSKDGRIPPGAIASVRLWVRDLAGQPALAGSTPVASDGSFYIRVPADQPIRFDLVDTAGHVLRAEKQWFWARKGEQRICVGCHAGPERAPANVAPAILDQSQTPVPIPGR